MLATHRAVEVGVTEGEDPAVGGHLPVAAGVVRRRHGDHRRVQMLVAHRAVELRAVAEDAAVGGDGPVAGLLRGTVAGGRGELHGGDVVGWGASRDAAVRGFHEDIRRNRAAEEVGVGRARGIDVDVPRIGVRADRDVGGLGGECHVERIGGARGAADGVRAVIVGVVGDAVDDGAREGHVLRGEVEPDVVGESVVTGARGGVVPLALTVGRSRALGPARIGDRVRRGPVGDVEGLRLGRDQAPDRAGRRARVVDVEGDRDRIRLAWRGGARRGSGPATGLARPAAHGDGDVGQGLRRRRQVDLVADLVERVGLAAVARDVAGQGGQGAVVDDVRGRHSPGRRGGHEPKTAQGEGCQCAEEGRHDGAWREAGSKQGGFLLVWPPPRRSARRGGVLLEQTNYNPQTPELSVIPGQRAR